MQSSRDDKVSKVSLTTRLHPRTFLAIRSLAQKENMTESAWVREFLEASVEIHAEPVSEEDVVHLSFLESSKRFAARTKKRRKHWFAFW